MCSSFFARQSSVSKQLHKQQPFCVVSQLTRTYCMSPALFRRLCTHSRSMPLHSQQRCSMGSIATAIRHTWLTLACLATSACSWGTFPCCCLSTAAFWLASLMGVLPFSPFAAGRLWPSSRIAAPALTASPSYSHVTQS